MVRPFHNSDQNQMMIFLHENLKIAYIEVQETNGKFLLKKKKTRLNFVRECLKVLRFKNFDQNARAVFLRLNFKTAYTKVQERNGKLFLKKKKKQKLVSISYDNASRFDRSTILTGM